MPSGLALASGYGSFPTRSVACSPPSGFRTAEGLRSAKALATGPFGAGPAPLRGSAAQKAGLRYERKVLDLLGGLFNGFQRSPWFEFIDRTGCRRFCQPDGLWLAEGRAVIFEVKIRHVSDAYYQLRSLYEPVVRKVFAPQALSRIILCRSFDPSVPFPEPLEILTELSPARLPNGVATGLYVWRL